MITEAQDELVTKHNLTEAKNEIKDDMNVRFERVRKSAAKFLPTYDKINLCAYMMPILRDNQSCSRYQCSGRRIDRR